MPVYLRHEVFDEKPNPQPITIAQPKALPSPQLHLSLAPAITLPASSVCPDAGSCRQAFANVIMNIPDEDNNNEFKILQEMLPPKCNLKPGKLLKQLKSKQQELNPNMIH